MLHNIFIIVGNANSVDEETKNGWIFFHYALNNCSPIDSLILLKLGCFRFEVILFNLFGFKLAP